MLRFKELNDKNLFLYAANHYRTNKLVDVDEFQEDLKRFKYIKRLLRKYKDHGVLKERLILNHIIVLNNVFGPDACSTLLLFKIEQEHWPQIKSFLSFLGMLPEKEMGDVHEDLFVSGVLRKL